VVPDHLGFRPEQAEAHLRIARHGGDPPIVVGEQFVDPTEVCWTA